MSNPQTQLRQLKDMGGIMSCAFTHDVVKTSYKFEWKGPTLNDIWPEVLAFFRWTNDTMSSESQVRLFVNTRTKEWKAWAFPQKAKTGMSARELTTGDEGYDKAIEQRSLFKYEDGWEYWGTAHHHCGMSAFQSGTDESNEKSQDGLHITVGNLKQAKFDIHYRVYLSGVLLNVPLDQFWDITAIVEQIPEFARGLMRPNIGTEIAKIQMGIPPAADLEFPQQWKDNVVDINPKMEVQATGQFHGQQGLSHYHNEWGHIRQEFFKKPFANRSKNNYAIDLQRASRELVQLIEEYLPETLDLEDLMNELTWLEGAYDARSIDVLDICCRNDVTPTNLRAHIEREMIKIQNETKQQPTPPQQQQGNGRSGPKHHGKAKKQQLLGVESMTDAYLRQALEDWENEQGFGGAGTHS